MAKDLNNGERLLSSILDNARAEANALLEKAREEASATAAAAEAEAARIEKEAALKADAARADVLERSRTNAALEARKKDLGLRRALMDEAFAGAGSAMSALAGSQREELLARLLLESAEGGETVLPAQKDLDALAGLMDRVNAGLAAKGKTPLCLGEATPGLADGFILRGPTYELNCSFAAIVQNLREAEEGQVAHILFG